MFAKNFHCFFPNAFTTFSAPACLMSGNRTLDKHVLKSPARQDSTGDSRIQRGFLLFAGAPSAKANEKDSNRRAACSDLATACPQAAYWRHERHHDAYE
ncbi:MAG: hypothetical protein DMG49_10220 [Acidobacteria bacterium]|nr:MAG: hypothetical protein DMG49_10220 [Acidobacteriota bacterium]